MKKVMRKVGLLASVLTIGVLLVGCSGSEEEVSKKEAKVFTSVFEMNTDGMEKTITYTYEEDKVLKQSSISIVAYESMGVSTKEEAEQLYSFVKDEYDIKGVTYSIDYQEKQMIEEVDVDYEQADMQEVLSVMGVLTDGTEADVEYISMKQSEEFLLEQGYKKKVDSVDEYLEKK